MDPIEILGNLLGHKSSGGGAGGTNILKEILLGGSRREAQPQSEPTRPGPTQSRPTQSRPASRELPTEGIQQQARELEDLLNVANNRSSQRATAQPESAFPPATPRQPAPGSPPASRAGGKSPARRTDDFQDDSVQRENEQAVTLIRAMVNAAKCDGQISQAEQQAILSRVGDQSPEAIQFLREEFSKPLDVREFAWSVPVGMEQQVYTMSLIAIDLDTDREDKYLRELAHGLRLSPEVCEQIKAQATGSGSRFAMAN